MVDRVSSGPMMPESTLVLEGIEGTFPEIRGHDRWKIWWTGLPMLSISATLELVSAVSTRLCEEP